MLHFLLFGIIRAKNETASGVSFRHNYWCHSLKVRFQLHVESYDTVYKDNNMKIVSTSIFVLTVTTSSLFAGNCAKNNKANLEAMSCEAGFTWNATKAECVQDTA